jgi:hypothetical protein
MGRFFKNDLDRLREVGSQHESVALHRRRSWLTGPADQQDPSTPERLRRNHIA